MLDYLRPTIAYLFSKLEDLQVFLVGERVSVNLWVKEIVPSLSALLTVSIDAKLSIQDFRYLLPLLGSFL